MAATKGLGLVGYLVRYWVDLLAGKLDFQLVALMAHYLVAKMVALMADLLAVRRAELMGSMKGGMLVTQLVFHSVGT